MKRTLVIADDLTGAAEIAGIATRYGLSTRLHRAPDEGTDGDVVVFDTDSRSMPAEAAAARVKAFLRVLNPQSFNLIYKKTDSVLRGNPRVEIETVLKASGRSQAVFVPQNPSRGRTIVGGIYRVNDSPLDQTAFANDPDRPATTSIAAHLLGPSTCVELPDAASADDIRRIAHIVDPAHAVVAGGADFFDAVFSSWHGFPPRGVQHGLETCSTKETLFLCGSTSSAANDLANEYNLPVLPMPQSVFETGDGLEDWPRRILETLAKSGFALATIGRPTAAGKAAMLAKSLADLAAAILRERAIPRLCLEGGATAAVICDRMNWTSLRVSGEVATGVVILQPARDGAPELIVKPGSYPWPAGVLGR